MHRILLVTLSAVLLSSASLFAQAQPNPAEARLREQLKAAMLQLRNAETEKATLQLAKAEAEKQIEAFKKDAKETGEKHAAELKKNEEEIAKLKEDIAVKDTDLKKVNELLVKSDAMNKINSELAAAKEAQRAKLAGEAITLQRTVADQRRKNAAMYEISTEVLSRYEKFGLGTAITAREPFTGITKARLQSMVDEYDGKISEQKIRVGGDPAKPAEAKAKPATEKPAAKP